MTKNGFTLIEISIVIAITILLAATTVSFYAHFQTASVIESTKQEIVQSLRLSQKKAASGLNNSRFGLFVNDSQWIEYQGENYANREQARDILSQLPQNLTFIEAADVNFSIKSGLPAADGIISIINEAMETQKTITINSEGLIY